MASRALITTTTSLYDEINEKAAEKFKIQWGHNLQIEVGYALITDCGSMYSLHKQKAEFTRFVDKFAAYLASLDRKIFITHRGTTENHRSPEYFDLQSLMGRYLDLQIYKVRLDQLFNKETHYGVNIYVANSRFFEVVNEDLMKFRLMMDDVKKKADIYGMKDDIEPMSAALALMGISKTVQVAGHLTDGRPTSREERPKDGTSGQNVVEQYKNSKEPVNLFKN